MSKVSYLCFIASLFSLSYSWTDSCGSTKNYASPNYCITIGVINNQIEFTTTLAGDLSA